MPKKKKLNSRNPKYWDKSQLKEQKIKERKLIANVKGIKVYGVFYENDTN
jgi:hypothetical protein